MKTFSTNSSGLSAIHVVYKMNLDLKFKLHRKTNSKYIKDIHVKSDFVKIF